MMPAVYQVTDNDGVTLNAHFELDGDELVFHSRGGSKSKNPINADYAKALRLVLERMAAQGHPLEAAWVDSSKVQALPREQRSIFGANDQGVSPQQAFSLISSRMKDVGRDPGALASGGNSTRRIRLRPRGWSSNLAVGELLGAIAVSKDFRSQQRLPASELQKVTENYVLKAVQQLLAGDTDHGFDPSSDYDLITEGGARLPPKAVFGIAASHALGFKVLPKHFAAGLNTPCFRQLEQAGFTIVPKGEAAPEVEELPLPPEDRQWAEGRPRLITHLKRERKPSLSRAKKAEFRQIHGKLVCERCGVDPVKEFGGDHGEACIEVHHHKVQVKDMDENHESSLDDLQCLCANCHRVVHRLLKEQDLQS